MRSRCLRLWGLVELQGQLETRDQVSFDDMHIGDLHFDPRGIPHLIIGHHLLDGKVVKLEKPLAVLQKKGRTSAASSGDRTRDGGMEVGCDGTDSRSNDEGMQVETEAADHPVPSGEACQEYEIVALITRKIIFKNRPKPIVTKKQSKKTSAST